MSVSAHGFERAIIKFQGWGISKFLFCVIMAPVVFIALTIRIISEGHGDAVWVRVLRTRIQGYIVVWCIRWKLVAELF